MRRTNPNLMLDEDVPNSTGRIINATRVCEAMEIPIKLRNMKNKYNHGWEVECLETTNITRTWNVMVDDLYGTPKLLCFDHVDGESPLMIVLEVKRYLENLNRGEISKNCF